MILIAIVLCEALFWVAILGGLAVRYLARRPRAGAVLLAAAPIIDVILLLLVAVDLLGGASASWHHGLAAVYIGVSIAYGHRMIGWADRQFARLVDGGPRAPRLAGAAYAIACWKDAARTLLAAALAAGILGALTLLVNAPERTQEFAGIFPLLGLIVVIDTLWAVSYSIWPRRSDASRTASAR